MRGHKSITDRFCECNWGQTLRHVILLTLTVGIFQCPLSATEWQVSFDVCQRLESIPQDDRTLLDELFRVLICSTQFGHVLFGEKPVASESSSIGHCYQDLWSPRLCLRLLATHWPVWERHRHLFPSNRFVLKRLDCAVFDGWPAREYLVIDRTQLRGICQKYDSLLRQTTGYDDSELMLEQLEKGGIDDALLRKRGMFGKHRVVGVLLGFGLHNASLFDRAFKMEGTLVRGCSIPTRFPPALKQIWAQRSGLCQLLFPEAYAIEAQDQAIPADKLSMIAEGYQRCWERLSETFQSLALDNPLSPVKLPICRVDPSHPETMALLRSYVASQRALNELLRQENFLEIVLTRVCAQ